MFNKIIKHNQSAKLKFEIIQMKSRHIGFGIVDYVRLKDSRSSYNLSNTICYWGHGNKWPENKKEGDGFKIGDVVEVNIDRATRIVKYLVNGVLQASQRNEMFAGADRIYVLYM